MNRAELIVALEAKAGVAKKDAEKVLKAFTEVVAEELKKGSKKYPVHYSGSDTTGEKAYEEFFTDTEQTDMNQFESLGVVTNRTARPSDGMESGPEAGGFRKNGK